MRRSPPVAGFTLIELLVVILLISILAATAASRFFTTDEFQPQQQRDAVINLLRQVQMESMQDSSGVYSRCPTVLLQTNAAGIARQNACNASASFTVDSSDLSQIDLSGSIISSTGNLPLYLRFDSWGRPRSSCSSGCTISFAAGGVTSRLCIEASGYIGAC